jgi:FAD/FMN-containing dehydrogenase/Fe-S oxidoreductase
VTYVISHSVAAAQRPSSLETRLRRAISGDVRFDEFTRGLYSTDASIYQIEPAGVVFPRSGEDVKRTIELAGEASISVIARGAGTSQSGQSIGKGLIVDTSMYLDDVLDFDATARRVVVRPGLVLDQLNTFLRPHGLFFPIDVATSSRATLGGMAGNNSAGSRSIRYGHMVEHVRGIEAVLASGERVWFGVDRQGSTRTNDNTWIPRTDSRSDRLIADVQAIYEREADELARRIPKVPRHVAGYALHRLQGTQPRFSDLLVGSEGTLAVFTALELNLQPIPHTQALGVCRFNSIQDALAAVNSIVELEPTAVELVDRSLLQLASDIPAFQDTLSALGGDRSDILIVEFASDDRAEIKASLAALNQLVAGIGKEMIRAEEPEFQRRIWGLRKAGLNISTSMRESRKPLAFIEDCVVPLPLLPEWHERMTEIIERNGTHAIWYAHASVGCLHVRPALDLRVSKDLGRLRTIAEEAFALVHELGGSHSGEHGDGWIRSEFIEPMLGPRLSRAFEDVKNQFDPEGRLNPGKIIQPPRMDDQSLMRTRYEPIDHSRESALDWSSWHGFGGAIEMCNRNGACRKKDPGVMCPSFRATEDERHSTRGRANALRLALTGQLGEDPWDSSELYEAMDLCIGCKGCKRECPTGVDMARMKIEYLHRRRAKHPPTLREWAVANLPSIAPWASRVPYLLNARNRSQTLAHLGERLLGLAANRALPTWSPRRFKWPKTSVPSNSQPSAGSVQNRREAALFVDTFTRYFEPENAYAAIRVLERAGYSVRPTHTEGRPLCCGRTFLNVGMVEKARTELARMTHALEPFVDAGTPVVGLEPSCLLTLRDELPALFPSDLSTRIATNAKLFTEFLIEENLLDELNLKPLPVTRIRVHGHCHEKAFGADGTTIEVLQSIPDLEVESIPAGCCGMAGSFGYESEHASVSRKIAELELLPAVRDMGENEWLVANGTSCRHQVADLMDRHAQHVATVLDVSGE